MPSAHWRWRRCVVLQPGEFLLLALLDVEFGDGARLVAHDGKEFGAFGDADGPARIEQVEGVALAQHKVVRGDDQAAGDAGLGFSLIDLEELLEPLDVGQLEVVDAVLDFGHAVDVAQSCALSSTAIDPDLALVLQDT